MSIKILTLGLIWVVFGYSSTGYAQDSSLVKKYQSYFSQQNLPYRPAQGCLADKVCIISSDFNNDNIDDFAGLYEYVGPKHRYKNKYLDLVIVYSDKKSSKLRHEVFTHIGKVDKNKNAMAKLAIQIRGVMRLPSGNFNLKNPGINIISFEEGDSGYFPTYYWHKNKFYALLKSH